ncbi:uncharacterized protein N7487_003074, partial [Penicillium crustosum]|uniref:uncharacterized protein n=1 Tax=Penicillium crustosum TaxID=36656 RepID=UPI0023A4065D
SILDDSPRLKCPLENHSQENVAEKQCYSIEVKRLIKGFHNPVSTSLRIDLLIVDEVQTGVGATEGLDFWLLLRQPRYTPTTGSTPSPCPHHPWDLHAFSLAYLRGTLSTFRTSVFVAKAKSFDVNIGGSFHQKVQHMHQGL